MGQTARDIHAGLALSWPAGLPRGGQSDYFPFRLNENAGSTPQDGSMGGGHCRPRQATEPDAPRELEGGQEAAHQLLAPSGSLAWPRPGPRPAGGPLLRWPVTPTAG